MNKQKIVPLLVLSFLVLGFSAFATSKLGTNTAHAQAAQVSQPSQKADDDTEMDATTEAKQLASLSKISSDQAKATAEKSVGGTATSVNLEEEHGNVVYAVTIGSKEVKVDAGNGKILKTEAVEADDSKEEDDHESN